MLGWGLGIAGAGAALGGLTGLMSGQSQRKAADQQRSYLESLMGQLGQQSTQLSAEERDRALIAQRKAARREEEAYKSAQRRTEYDLRAAMESPQYQVQAKYIMDMYSKGIPDVLAGEMAGRLRTAQAARGLEFGGAPIQAEASLLTSMAERGRQAMLPQLRQLALDPMQLRQQQMAAQLQQQAASQGLGLAELQSTMQSLQAAQGIASSRMAPSMQATMGLGSQVPFSAVDPWAQFAYPFSSALTLLGAGMAGAGMTGVQPRPDVRSYNTH